jgi:hypothetical protein
MKRQISDDQLCEAFESAQLGSGEYYDCWTALWALRSQIWRGKRMQKDARNSLGEVTKSAIEDGNPAVFRHLAGALDEMLAFERRPENARRADVFFAIEELNRSRERFTRTDLFSWLNKELDASITEEELDRELKRMKLADLLPV